MNADQERVRLLLKETISLLCRNGLLYEIELKVEGLLGITVDKNQVFIVHLNETITDQRVNTDSIIPNMKTSLMDGRAFGLVTANDDTTQIIIEANENTKTRSKGGSVKREEMEFVPLQSNNSLLESPHEGGMNLLNGYESGNERLLATDTKLAENIGVASVKMESCQNYIEDVTFIGSDDSNSSPPMNNSFESSKIDVVHDKLLPVPTKLAKGFKRSLSNSFYGGMNQSKPSCNLTSANGTRGQSGQFGGFRPKSRGRSQVTKFQQHGFERQSMSGAAKRPRHSLESDYVDDNMQDGYRGGISNDLIRWDCDVMQRSPEQHQETFVSRQDCRGNRGKERQRFTGSHSGETRALSKWSRWSDQSLHPEQSLPSDMSGGRGSVSYPVHRRTVYGANKDYICPHESCGKTFYHMRNLLRHQRLKHS